MTTAVDVLTDWLVQLIDHFESGNDPEYQKIDAACRDEDWSDRKASLVLPRLVAERMLDPERQGILSNPEFVSRLPGAHA
jgi:hypothetical protein